MEGAEGEIRKTVESVKIVSVYRSIQNNKIKVTVSNKCYDIFEYISNNECAVNSINRRNVIANGNGC